MSNVVSHSHVSNSGEEKPPLGVRNLGQPLVLSGRTSWADGVIERDRRGGGVGVRENRREGVGRETQTYDDNSRRIVECSCSVRIILICEARMCDANTRVLTVVLHN